MAEEDAEENPWMAAFELSAASWLETHPDASSNTGWPEVLGPLNRNDLLLTDEGEVYDGAANGSASRGPLAGDNAEGNSPESAATIHPTAPGVNPSGRRRRRRARHESRPPLDHQRRVGCHDRLAQVLKRRDFRASYRARRPGLEFPRGSEVGHGQFGTAPRRRSRGLR